MIMLILLLLLLLLFNSMLNSNDTNHICIFFNKKRHI